MINNLYDIIINKMGSLVNDNGQCTSKLGKNVFVQKLGSHHNSVGVGHLCFHSLCCIISGY
jgi:hypothetical protein